MGRQTDTSRVCRPARGLVAVGLLTLLSIAAVPAEQRAEKQTTFEEIHRRGLLISANLKTLNARFTETTTSTLLTRPLVARGTVAVEHPMRVVLRYTDPESRTILIDGNYLTLSWPSRHLRTVSNIASTQRRIQKYFVDSSPQKLRELLDIQTAVANDRQGTYRLTMVPKRKQLQEGLSRLEVWVDQASLLMAAMRMTFANGESKLFEFADVVTNGPVDPALFKIEPQ